MERTTTQAGGIILSVIAIGIAYLSFRTIAPWGLILALAAIACGILGIALSQGFALRRQVFGMIALSTGVIGTVLGIIRAIEWVFTPILR